MEFTEILEEYEIPFHVEGHHHTTEGWIQIDCPFCGKDSGDFHMGFSIESSFINCWKCGHHSVIDALMEVTGETFQQCKVLVENMDVPIFSKKKKTGKFRKPRGVGGLSKAHKTYLKGRGFSISTLIRLWGIQGISLSLTLPWRVYIPIVQNGQPVSWTTRAINDKGVRYLSAKAEEESVPHQTLLYGEDYARHCVVICEGPTDVWNIGPGAVATLGMNTSQAQINKMIKYPNRVILFDNEKEAQKRAIVLRDTLSLFPGNTTNVILDSKDAGSASKKEVRKFRKIFL